MKRLRNASIDVHQHLWPVGLIEALRHRGTPPRLRGWTLELPGEPPYHVDPRDHDVGSRLELASADGLDVALVSLSSPFGLESLPPEEAGPLLGAYHDGVAQLPAPFLGWAAACLTAIDPAGLRDQLDRGFAGLQLPATALADVGGYERAGALLEILVARGRPLMIHPGPAASPVGAPAWWAPIVSYVQQMHAAWFAFQCYGRSQHPELRVCFAMLAGLAPLHGERVAARGGPRSALDDRVFLDTSSYGPRAIDAVVRVLGVDALVAGSDRPYAAPLAACLGPAADLALRSPNPSRLLGEEVISNAAALATGT